MTNQYSYMTYVAHDEDDLSAYLEELERPRRFTHRGFSMPVDERREEILSHENGYTVVSRRNSIEWMESCIDALADKYEKYIRERDEDNARVDFMNRANAEALKLHRLQMEEWNSRSIFYRWFNSRPQYTPRFHATSTSFSVDYNSNYINTYMKKYRIKKEPDNG